MFGYGFDVFATFYRDEGSVSTNMQKGAIIKLSPPLILESSHRGDDIMMDT